MGKLSKESCQKDMRKDSMEMLAQNHGYRPDTCRFPVVTLCYL